MSTGHRHYRRMHELALALLLVLCGCNGDGTSALPAGKPAGPSAVPAVLQDFSPPSSYLARAERGASDIDEPLFKSGSARSLGLPAQSVDPFGNRMNFYPSWSPGDPLAQTAYCGYCFDLTGFSEALEFSVCFATAPEHSGQAWLGLGNFTKNAWDWFAVPLCGVVAPASAAPYCHAGDDSLLALLVVTGEEQLQLANIRIGNQAPTAHFTKSSGLGMPGTTVDFDGSTSSEPDGNIYRWQWDPEGDGTYLFLLPGSHGSPYKSFTYSQPGSYQPTLRITDDSGATDTFSDSVVITLGNLYSGTLDAETQAGTACSAALVNGRAAVAYMMRDELRYMRALDIEAFNWSAPQVIDPLSGGWPDLAVIAGRPAIAFQSGGLDLGYVRANNADGSSWPVPLIAYYKTAVPIGHYPSLAEVGGLPAVVHGDQQTMDWGGNLWYLRALDVTGNNWLAIAQVNKPGSEATHPALGFVAGVPTVSFLSREIADVNYVELARANDPLGETWPWPTVAVASGYPYCSGSALLDTGGKPSVGFLDLDDDTVNIARCKDAGGISWWGPASVAAGQGGCYSYAFLVLNGLPCCAFDGGDAGLCYVIAKNSGGSAWNEPLVLDAASRASYISLFEINGAPAIAYYDSTSESLKFAIYI